MIDPHRLATEHSILAVIVGSRAYGLAQAGSDTDRRGVYAAPTPLFWALDKPPTHVDGPAEEQFSWEVERFCALALTANPTLLECLWTPLVEHRTEIGAELLDVRQAFLSRRATDTYGRYAAAQWAKLVTVRERTGVVRWKQAMHMLRLLQAGAYVLRTGEVLVDVGDERTRMLSVRAGERTFEEVSALAQRLTEELSAAADACVLPDEPDRRRVDDFLIRTRVAGLR